MVLVLGLLDSAARVEAAAGTAVRCGTTLTKDTVLDHDLLDCPGDGLVIGRNGITVDLNGHLLRGSYDLSPGPDDHRWAGVRNRGYRNVTVKGGSIVEFGSGVHFSGSAKSVVADVYFGSNRVGAWVTTSHGVAIHRVRGAEQWRAVVRVAHSREIEIRGITTNENGNGVVLFRSDRSRIVDNRISNPGHFGITLVVSDNNVIARNSLPPGDGGFTAGVAVLNSDGNWVLNNTSSEQSKGFLVGALSSGTLLGGNIAIENGSHGFEVRNADTALSGNTANSNGALGIAAVPGVEDAGGNRAAGNRDPRQCLNVRCRP